jgi:hypothetical protein
MLARRLVVGQRRLHLVLKGPQVPVLAVAICRSFGCLELTYTTGPPRLSEKKATSVGCMLSAPSCWSMLKWPLAADRPLHESNTSSSSTKDQTAGRLQCVLP